MTSKLFVGLFGVAGVFARYFLGWLVTKNVTVSFPAGTFIINILGSFFIGMVYVLGVERAIISEPLRLGLMIGFLGGFTTFSSFSLETARLLERSEYVTAISYFLLSPVLGLISAFAGLALTRFFIRA